MPAALWPTSPHPRMPKKRFPEPFFFFDEANASMAPSPPDESLCAFFRRLDTQDGERLRCLLNRCMARFTDARKRNEMKSRLENGNDREQAGVLTELLMSEILYAISSTLEIEPKISAQASRPDFRIWDENQNSVTVEVTHFMGSSDQRHRESLAWNSVIHQLRPVVRPIPAMVTVEAIGIPTKTHISKQDRDNVVAGIQDHCTIVGNSTFASAKLSRSGFLVKQHRAWPGRTAWHLGTTNIRGGLWMFGVSCFESPKSYGRRRQSTLVVPDPLLLR